MSKQKYTHVDVWQYPRLSLFYKKSDISFGGHFDFILKSVVSILYQYSECNQGKQGYYHNYVKTYVSNLKLIKFIKDYDIGHLNDLITYAYIQNGGYQPFVFFKNVEIMLDIVIMLAKCKES